ncbi:MAG: antibiotic biosynthesis monooxygenase [Chloroflexi bacterium]|nr:antibiotic biosynthesis monooxygenase [Chloroflexota bacterium]
MLDAPWGAYPGLVELFPWGEGMSMYGTVARMRVKPGRQEQLQKLNDEWVDRRGRQVSGYVASYVLRPDNQPDELILLAIFKDRESYRANASDPEQDRWYRQMREQLEADPEWTDGEMIFASTSAGA